jgi:nicotinamidase/pyrazinamidase
VYSVVNFFRKESEVMKALLVVDVQNDFCPGGALPAPGGDKVVPVINSLIDKFPLIIASKDWHPEITLHFDKWPKHCVQGTKGAELHPDLRQDRLDQIVLKGAMNMDEGYSVFEGIDIDLEKFLRDRGVNTLYVTGLVTEYCVKETALDAQKRGFSTYVIKDAVEGVRLKKGDVERAFEEMKKAGVRLISSSEV